MKAQMQPARHTGSFKIDVRPSIGGDTGESPFDVITLEAVEKSCHPV